MVLLFNLSHSEQSIRFLQSSKKAKDPTQQKPMLYFYWAILILLIFLSYFFHLINKSAHCYNPKFELIRLSMQVLAQATSKKVLSYIPNDPLFNVFKQLKENNAKQGDYFRIIDREMRFIPIYKITSIIEPNIASHQDSLLARKSMYIKQTINQILITQKKPEKEAHKFRLSFGSQIYLKNADLSKPKVEILRPYFQNLYVWLKAKKKGFIQTRDERIVYHQTMQTSSIWLCMLAPTNSANQENGQKEVVFCNFDDGSFLHLDQSGVFMLCSDQRATKFTLKSRLGPTNYIVQGINVLSQMVKNKSKEEIKKIIDRNIERNLQKLGSRRILQTQLEIIPVQDSYVTIQLQLNYSLIALEFEPSLKLIKTIFDELIYYGILQFATDNSLINDHLEKLLLQKNIFHSMCSFLIKYVENTRKESQRFEQVVITSPKKKSPFIISKDLKNFQKLEECASVEMECKPKLQIEQNQQLFDLLERISVVCKRNHLISQIFEPLLGLMIQLQYFQLASILLSSNQFFISKFYKMGWYNQLYKKLLKLSKSKISKLIPFLCKFCESQSIFDPTGCGFVYKQVPSTNNQYLIYNSIKNGEYYSKIFQFQLYAEGLYVFVHNQKSDKDIQFFSFIQGQSQGQVQSIQHMMEIKQNTLHFNQQQKLLLSQLAFLKAVSDNYNCNIFINHWPIVYALAPYCYRDNFPHLQNSMAIKAILNLIIACDITNKDSIIFSKNTISYIITNGAEDKRVLAEEVGDFKLQLSHFMKDFRKKSQISRKTIKQMGNYFMKMSKLNYQLIKKKELKAMNVYEKSESNCLTEWLKLMYVYFLKRSSKVKQKKEGQLISYIKKFFESVQKQKRSDTSQQNLITFFIQYLLQLLNFNLKYESHLSNVKVKRNYEGKITNQINKVISNFQSKKQVFFSRKHKSFTKIQFINIIYKGIQRQSQRQQIEKLQKTTLPIKILVSQLLQLILETVKQESVDESVQTLNYLIKNSNDLSSISSFSLLQMINKFPMQSRLKQIVLQQWYFASNCKYLNQLTSLLRLLYYKKTVFKASVNEVFLFDKPQLLKIFHNLIYPSKFLKKMSFYCQAWLRQSLFDKFDKYGDIYESVLRYLQIINAELQKLNSLGEDLFVSKLVQNLNILKSLSTLTQYISTFYIQKQKNKAKDQRLFNISVQSFFDIKLNLLSNNILKIIYSYISCNSQIKLKQAKIFLHIYGQLFSQTHFFSQLLLKIFWEAQYLPMEQKVSLMKFVPMNAIAKLCQFLPNTWAFIQFYCEFEGEQFVHFVEKLHNVGFKRQEPAIQQIHQIIFVGPIDNKAQNQQESKCNFLKQLPQYEYMHQIAFFRLVLKLIYSEINLQFVDWFKDKFFWNLLQHNSQLNFQKTHKNVQKSIFQLEKKRLICELAFQFRHQRAGHSAVNMSQDLVLSEIDHLVIQYLREQIKEIRQQIAIPMGHQSVIVINNINDPLKIQYLEYVVCDLIILSKQVDFLKDQATLNYFRQCCKILKNYYRIRIIEKQNDNTHIFIAKVEKILTGAGKENQQELSMRRLLNKPNLPEFRKKTQRNQRSKPLRKWDKAVQQLNNQKCLSKHSQLVQDMIEFNNIYEFKSEAQDLSFVLNHQDFFFKLVQSSLNMKRLNLSQENQIFIMEQLYLTAKQKAKNKKQVQLIQYAQRLLQNIAEEQEIESIKEGNLSYSEWKTNTYVLSLKLQIIAISKLFEQREKNKFLFPLIISIFQMALSNYQKDLAFFELLRSTFFSKEEKQFCQLYLPFDIVLNIIIEQITFEGMAQYQAKICTQIVKASLETSSKNQSEIIKYTNSDIFQIIEKMENEIVHEIHKELKQKVYCNYLLSIKK